MAIFFILFLVVIFICVMVIKSSMNYEFGSDRKRTTIRLSVVATTLAAVIVHSILATILLNLIWTDPTRDDPAAGLVILFLAVTPGTLIWGFTVPKVVFAFVGTKPTDADNRPYVDDSTPSHEDGWNAQPATNGQQRQTNQGLAYPWEEEPRKKSKKPLLIGAGSLALLATAAVVITTFMLTGGSPAQATPGICDTWLRQQLVDAPRATASADNANLVVAHVQSQRPEHCPQDNWNPLVTDIARHSDGNITVSFSTATGNSRGTTVTLPSDGALYWEYDHNEQTWNAPPELTYQPPEPTPTNAVQVARQPATTSVGQSNPSPTNAPTMVPTLPPDSFVEIGNSESFYQQAWSEAERGDDLRDAGNYHGAIAAYQSAQAYHGKPSSVLENHIGLAFQAMGNHERAIDHFSKAIEINDGPTDRVNRADSYLETEQCPLAIHDAQQALEMKADSTKGIHTGAEARYILGVCQLRSGDNTQAVIHLRTALTLMRVNDYTNETLASTHEAIGNALYAEGQHLQAIEHYSQAIALDDNASTRASRASAYKGVEDCANASADAQAALKMPAVHWDSDAEAHVILGYCQFRSGDSAQAVIHLRAALTLMRVNDYTNEGLATTLKMIGDVLYSEGQHLQAIEHYSQAIGLDDTASARAIRAWAYVDVEDCMSASADAQAALRLRTSHWHGYHSGAEAHSALSYCRWEQGELDQALQHAEQALALMRENRYEPELIAEAEAEIRFMREQIDSSQPTGANANDPDYAAFAAQRTRVAPTKAALISQTLASADKTMTKDSITSGGC